MKTTVSSSSFHRAFEQMRPDNFSSEGLDLLYEYLESLEADTGEEIELDVIALCCDYSEDTIEDIINNYDIEAPEASDGDEQADEERREAVRAYLEEHTTIVGETSDGFVYCQSF